MSKKNGGKHTLEGLLAFSNEQILGKWSTLASLIRHNEYDERDAHDWSKGWHPSREKALYLLNTNSADEYIEKVRNRVSPKTTITEPILPSQVEEPKPKDLRKRAMPKSKRSIYAKNYERLVKLIPDLEDRIVNGLYIDGLINPIGFHGMVLFKPAGSDSHITDVDVYHYVEENDKYRVETMFSLRIDIAKMRVESLKFRCKNGSCLVYHQIEGVVNPLLDTKERDRQNWLLADFLKSLLRLKQRIEWYDETKRDLYHALTLSQYSFGKSDSKEPEWEEVEDRSGEDEEAQAEMERLIREEAEREERIAKERRDREEAERLAEQLALERKQELERKRELETPFSDLWKERINDHIPEFEPGNVQYLEVHQTLGLRQQDIDWINRHKQGLTLFPVHGEKRRHPNFTGFRICRKGQVYFGGRSTRVKVK